MREDGMQIFLGALAGVILLAASAFAAEGEGSPPDASIPLWITE